MTGSRKLVFRWSKKIITYPLYDNVGNRREEVNDIVPTEPFHYTYAYNERYELTDVSDQVPASQFNYLYDGTGNRLSSTEEGSTVAYTPNNLNQYSDVDGTAFTYDLKGNLTGDGTFDYVYDYGNG